MTPAEHRFTLRLLALLVAVAALWQLGCRPAFSPDGRRVLFLARADGNQLLVACHDRTSGATTALFTPPLRTLALPLWTADGQHAVVLWGREKGREPLQLTFVDPATRAVVRSLPMPVVGDAENLLLLPPVVLGSRLFVADQGVHRLDLATGQSLRKPAAKEELALARLGDGICYMAAGKRNERQWEFGRLDPDSLERTPLLTAPADFPWQLLPFPAASPGSQRIAFPAQAVDEDGPLALLVFADGALEATLPLGPHREVECGSLAWLPDGVTLVAGLARRGAERAVTWSLYETTLSGSVNRETTVLRGTGRPGLQAPLAMSFPFAIAPDGRTAAASTVLLEDLPTERHGLYLVDLASRRRTVSQLPFPAPPPGVRLATSDLLLGLGDHWANAWVAAAGNSSRLSCAGGGSEAALQALLRADCDLALLDRPASAAERAAAQAAGPPLVEHTVALQALAVVVHADNGLASLTLEQLARIFRDEVAPAWTTFGAAMPDSAATIAAVHDAAARQFFADTVQPPLPAARRVRTLANGGKVVQHVAARPAAIGLVEAGRLVDTVRTVPIAAEAGQPGQLPEAAALGDGRYPLTRTVRLYTRGEGGPAVAAFVQWLRSEAGRAATARAGFMAPVR